MSLTVKELLAAALALPEAERWQLVAELMSAGRPDPEIERAILAEVRERVRAYDAGELETVSHEEAMRLIAG